MTVTINEETINKNAQVQGENPRTQALKCSRS
jgi:hypothetical protein